MGKLMSISLAFLVVSNINQQDLLENHQGGEEEARFEPRHTGSISPAPNHFILLPFDK